RVLTKGFAYDYAGKIPKGLLRDKKVMIFSTTGGMRIAYYLLGIKAAIKKSIDFGIFNFCGMRVILRKYFYAVPVISAAARSKMLANIEKIGF
ncbi:MAG: flavodoxin family protein, partial [Candidatus Omnitrophica bacterium]|nr:flavodoxin family protein [Candidatus Omnitrophota bacterium]